MLADDSMRACWCDHDGRADFWLETKPGMTDLQKGGLFLFSIMGAFSRVLQGQPLGGTSCDISENSILAIAGRSRGVAVGPAVYAHNACKDAPSAEADCSTQAHLGCVVESTSACEP